MSPIKSKQPRILIVTHAFPPFTGPNSKRPYYVSRFLAQQGCQVDVLTTRQCDPHPNPEIFEHENFRVLRVRDRVLDWVLAGDTRTIGRKWNLLAGTGFSWPDPFIGWAKKAMRIASEGNYDKILCFILPTALLAAANRSQALDKKFIFDYQESVSPYQKLHPRQSPITSRLAPRLWRIESEVLHRCGSVVFTSEINRRTYIEQGIVPEAITHHVPYFYDTDLMSPTNEPTQLASDKLAITYFGSFDSKGDRTPEAFFCSLESFFVKHPDAKKNVVFRFWGLWRPEHNIFIERHNLHTNIEIHPPLAYADYLNEMRRSPALLLITASEHNLFMPSKIVDYFGANRPILAFVPDDSEMHLVLAQAKRDQYSVSAKDSIAGATAIERLWRDWQSHTISLDPTAVVQWSDARQLARYEKIVMDQVWSRS